MFTGIIEELGSIAWVEGPRVRIAASLVTEDAKTGDSIAVDGCCLSVVDQGPGWFAVEVSPETLARTALGD